MMSKTHFGFLALVFCAFNFQSYAQNNKDIGEKIQKEESTGLASSDDPVLLIVGKREIHVSEFEAIYKKNNEERSAEGLEEYLDLYVNFRLKVADAEAQGLDTTESFKKELAGYRRQLAEPYLSDNEVTEELIDEAYERMKYVVRASHILIKVGASASPTDTMKAYKRAVSVKRRIEKGEDFATVARQVDENARESGGDLGYFRPFKMIYPFETAVYNAEVGKVTGPVRTRFGYHIILVTEKMPYPGEITTEHIMTRLSQDYNEGQKEAARMKIDEIYAKLQSGENFEELAKQYSEDKGTAARGGLLPPFKPGDNFINFEKAAFALQNDGDYSKVIETGVGFHIIKRISLKPLESKEELTPYIKKNIAKDSRSRKSKVSFLNRVKKEYGFKEDPKAMNDFYRVIDSTLFHTEWKAGSVSQLDKTMFTLGDSSASQQNFARFLEKNRTRRRPGNINTYLDRMYETFKENYITQYEDVRLESKYPEFKLLMQEYHDGILLFDLTDEKVWSKAVKDSAGLAAYYEVHKSENMWPERVEGVWYACANEDVAKSVKKMVKSREKKSYDDAKILEMANEESQLNLELERGKYSKGDNAIVDEVEWKKGISNSIEKDNRVYFVEIIDVLPSQPKELSEVRGLMTSGYQAQLEEEWLTSLKEKYPVQVNMQYLPMIE